MKKALITGIHGFAGTHLCAELLKEGYDVTGLSRGISRDENRNWEQHVKKDIPIHITDLSDPKQISSLDSWKDFDCVFHLAGIAFVPYGWEDPAGVLESNTVNTIHLLQSLKSSSFKGRFVFISSSEVYGNKMKSPDGFKESEPCDPENPYAASKLSGEMFARYFTLYGIDILIARPFNHIGPGQKENFVVPSFCKRVSEAVKEKAESIIVGELQSKRDFTDVRDVASAYRMIAEKGENGNVYNVSTGIPITIQEILDTVQKKAGTALKYKIDPSLLRPEGPTVRFGNSKKLHSLGWKPTYSLADSIQDMYDFMKIG